MTIKQRIIGKSLGTALLVAAVGVLSAASMVRIGRTLRSIEIIDLRETGDADLLEGAAGKIDHLMDQYRASAHDGKGREFAALETQTDAAFDQIAQATSRLDQAVGHQTENASQGASDKWDATAQLDSIEEQVRLSREEWSKVRSDVGSHDGAKSDLASLDRLNLATGALLKASLEFEHGAKDEMMRGLRAAQGRVIESVRALIIAACLAVLISLVMARVVALPIASRLARLRDGVLAVGRGDLDAYIGVASGDEIGQLTTAFNEMSAGLRRSREEVQESESKFRELAEAVNEVFWIVSPDGSVTHYISPAYEEVWGRSRESIYNDPRSFTDAIVPEDRPRFLSAMEKMAVDGMNEEYRIIRPDGTMRWIHARGFVVRDQAGKAQRMVGIAADVTVARTAQDALWRAHEELERRVEERTAELQQANEALRQSEADRQHANDAAEAANHARSVVFDTALDAIVTIDSRGLITAWNLQAETMFRWDRNEVVGKRIDQTIIPERHWDAHRREIERFLKTGEGPLLDKVVEIVALRRNGREFPVELAITPALSGGEWSFTAFIRDITVRKQAEVDLRQARDAAETASGAKSEFLAKMSHEIRTPLNGVIGMSGLLLDTALDPDQRRFTRLIRSSGESLLHLINDILDFSKIEARKLEIESLDFDLYSLVEEVNEMMSIKAAEKGLELACLTLADVPRRVRGDPQRVKQILVNLVNNAIKFTETGAVSTRVTLDQQSPEHAFVRFSVTDTGIGIPADRMDRLFQSFSQVDSSTTRIYGGTGLGLAIAKQLAELMGGVIGVESAPGQGSTFWFTVRLGMASQIPVPAVAVDPRGLRVLAVHDSAMMRDVLRSQLCAWGLEAQTAPSGEAAMKMLLEAAASARPYDAAILDGELPDIDTMELGRAIKARSETAATVLLILLPVDSNVDPATLADFSGHLNKPVRQSILYDSIVTAMACASGSGNPLADASPIATESESRTTVAFQQARVLVAEDNRVNQIVATEVLSKQGFSCDIVDNGRKAVAAVAGGAYGLVLMDCSMPEMDGFEATRQIREAEQDDPAQPPRHIPIIALTANAIHGDRERCLEAGMDDYVSKPIDPGKLIEAIRALLAKSSPATALQSEIDSPAVTAAAPSAIAPDEAPPMAIEAVLGRCMGDSATVSLILDEFERQAAADLAELSRLVANGDCAATARVAHALKGASGMLSADALAGVAFKLEQMGRAGTITDEGALLTQLNDEVQRCIRYLPTARAAIAKNRDA